MKRPYFDRTSIIIYSIICILCLVLPSLCLAQTPFFYEVPSTPTTVAPRADMPLNYQERQNLQNRLKTAVFVAFAHQPKPHELAESGLQFDGAVVAIQSSHALDIIPKDEITEAPPKPANPHNPSSFFDTDLNYVSSPFQKRPEPQSNLHTGKQYYLTTADWLTNSTSFEIVINQQKIPAKLEYRDDAQNLAMLSTPIFPESQVNGVEIWSPDENMPSQGFALLSPDTRYESFTQHPITITEEHLYGSVNLIVRNGYPLFSTDAKLLGLIVGPDLSRTTAKVVHSGLIDRALHPQKYDRTKTETIEVIKYGGSL